MAKIILMDWQRGKIPFFVPPPGFDEKKEDKVETETKVEEISEDQNQKVNLNIKSN